MFKKYFLKYFERNKEKFSKKAEKYARNPDKMLNLLKTAKKKANSRKGPLDDVWDKLLLVFSLVGDYAHGRYKEIPVRSIIAIIVGILYLVSPIDAIPDFFIGLGLIDDATVLAFVFSQLKVDIGKYQQWKEDANHLNNAKEVK